MHNNNNNNDVDNNTSITTTIKKTRRNLILALIGAIAVVNSIVLVSSFYDQTSLVTSADLSRIFTIGSAVIMSIIVIIRQGIGGIFGRAYLSIAIGIILWLAAESTWGYYELGLGVERPFPSLADGFWLAGYAPIGYHLFSMSRFYGRGTKKKTIAIVGAGVAIFSGIYIVSLMGASELDGTVGAMEGIAISIAYPILDAILFVPAILIVLNSGRGLLTSIPWIFISWIFLWLADTILGFTAVQKFQGNEVFVNSWYTVAYLTMTIGLWWYNRFFVFDEARYSSSSSSVPAKNIQSK